MAMTKMHQDLVERLDRIEAKVEQQPEPAPTVTKKQLMEIDGVGPATAEKILELLGQ